jgi:hypothetical protein
LSVLLVGLGLGLASGCEQKCLVPAGDYAMTVEPITGDCPDEVLATFDAYSDVVTVDPETECSQFVTSVDGNTEGGCDIKMDISATSTKAGLEDGQAVLNLTCGEKFSCRHEFDVIFQQKK